MRTEVTVTATPGRMPRLTAVGGLAARSTGPDTVHLIGTAATPLGGDHIVVRVRVERGARLTLRTVAATIALPARGEPASTAEWEFDVEDDGVLIVDPRPIVVAAHAQHRSVTTVRAAATATVEVTERVQIGRAGETSGDGYWSGALRADIDKRPRLRHRLELGRSSVVEDAVLAPRALVSTLTLGGESASGATIHGSTPLGSTVTLPLAGGGTLATTMGFRLPAERQ